MATDPAEDTLARGLAEAWPDALAVIGPDHCVAFANRRCELLFGYGLVELVGKELEFLIPELLRAARHEDRGDSPTTALARLVGAARSVVGRRSDGAELPLEVTLIPMRTPGGTVFALSIREASRPQPVEETLHEREDRFRLAFERAPIGMALARLDGRFLRVNDALCGIVGYTRDELVTRTFQEITHTDDLEKDTALAARLARGEIASYQLGKRYVRKDGALVDVMLSRSLLHEANGAPPCFLIQVEDISARVKAEAALRRSEADLRDLIEQAPEAVFVADLDGRYTNVNSAACRMLGYAPEELLGKTIADLVPASDLPRLAAAREFLLGEESGNRVQVAEWALQRKDGTRVPAEVSAKIHPDGRWVAFVRDMSERKRNAEALRRSEESFARAQRVAHLGSWDWDVRTNLVERSDEIFALFGLEPNAIGPQRWSMAQYVHPDDRARVLAVQDEAARQGHAYTLEHRIFRADGAERIVLQHGEPILEDGRAVRVVGTLLDITERRRAELEREQSLTWLRGVFEHSPVALLLVSKEEHVEANACATALIGRPFERLGQYADMLLDATGVPLRGDQLPSRRALRGEQTDWTEYLLRQPGGTMVPVLGGAAPIRNSSGDVEGAVLAFQDITAAKELERLRAEWSSVVAHDLRQPLHTISLYAQFLLRTTKGHPDAVDALERIKAAGHRLNRMIGDLMDLSRLEAHRLELARQPLDVVLLVRESLERLALESPDRAVDLRVHGDVRRVSIDRDRIEQVLENLLSNAVKYSTPETAIVVEVEGGSDDVTVAVTNEGRGIAPEELSRLFQRFQRTSDAKAAGIKGIGLGLYITRELVEAHGGRLTVESTPGARTTFRFTLPCC